MSGGEPRMPEETHTLVKAELLAALRGYEAAGKPLAYPLQMWKLALDLIAQSDQDVGVTEECDAIPYVPFVPEDFGVSLGVQSRVLDVGCLGGYGLFDFAYRRQRAGRPVPRLTGVDIAAESVQLAEAMATIWAKGMSVRFERAEAGSLPLGVESFDLVVARLLLPYVRIESALDEIARVLRAPGMVLLQVHAPRYYATRAWTRLAKPAAAFYYLRPLVSGLLFAALRRQPRHPWLAETALSAGRLAALCARRGLNLAWRGGFEQKPLLGFVKPGRAA